MSVAADPNPLKASFLRSMTACVADAVDAAPIATWLFVLGLAGAVFSGNSALMGLPISLDRIFIPAAVFLILVDPRRPPIRWRAVHAFCAFYVGWAALSMVSHQGASSPGAAFAFLDRIVLPLVLFVCAPLLFPDEVRRRLLLRFLVILGVWLSLNAVFEIIGPHALVWPRYILESSTAQTSTVRAQGPFLASEALGMMLLLSGTAAMATAASESGGWRRVGALAAPVCFLASILSMTRSIWLGAVLVLLIAGTMGRHLRRMAAGVISAVVVGAGVVAATLPDLVVDFFERLGMSSSLYDRANTNAAALRIIAERPLEGIGWGRFIVDGASWVRQASDYPITNVGIEIHNVFLSRAAELGLPGSLALCLCLLTGPLWILLRTRKTQPQHWWLMGAAALAIWLVPSMSSPNSYPLPNHLFWVISGILGSHLLTWPSDTVPDEPPPPALQTHTIPLEDRR